MALRGVTAGMSTDSRYQMEVDVSDAFGRPAKLKVGAENGNVIVLTPGGDGFSMSPSQTQAAVDAFTTASDAAILQRGTS